MEHFYSRVYALVEQIPLGKVTTYGQLARALGNPRAARAVGWAMRHCPEHLPWQRVVMADGTVTGGEHAGVRRALLEAEGIVFRKDGRVDLRRHNHSP
ncbi:MAG: methylated-DNA--[protein]-cysteine S-methyltransferase [Defluviitaleaceae bacterium]|nr:methylated-DNA--[protein]-cysteine S-methyltransferase [Defluviitaleaceae bacterium]